MAQVTCPVRMPRSDDPARVCGEPFPSALEALEHVKTAHDQARYEYDRISGETIARLIETNGLDFDVENGPAMAAAIRELIAAEVMRREGRRQSPIPTAVGDLYPGEMLTSIEFDRWGKPNRRHGVRVNVNDGPRGLSVTSIKTIGGRIKPGPTYDMPANGVTLVVRANGDRLAAPTPEAGTS